MKKNGKKLAKIIAPVALAGGCLATMPTTGCSNTSMYYNVHKKADYLYEITYDDYRYDADYETIEEAEAFGCSSVRRGQYYGRNFDYVYNDTPEFIVHVKEDKRKKRHASLAVATHFGLREEKMAAGKYDKQLELIPNLTMDGINDQGVICSSNVVSMEPNEGETITPETRPNEGLRKLHVLFIPRFVLDNANSAADAVEKLKTVNIFGDLDKKMYIHTMIADKDSTYVVEFYHDKNSPHQHFDVIAREKGINTTDAIMTNCYVNLDDEHTSWVNDEKFGNERLAILKDGYNTVESFGDMVNLMQRVKFSIAYQEGHNPVPINIQSGQQTGDLTSEWYSEFIKQSICEQYFSQDPAIKKQWEKAKAALESLKERWETKDRKLHDHDIWHTTHNSTYDLENSHLCVYVQENYGRPFDFYLK